MKSLLTDPEYSSWSITSLAYFALKNNTLSACVSTWYKYANILGITRSTTRNRRKDKKTGIRADETNKIWHMDVTVFKTMDNVKAYIYILMDNFSRCILNYRVSLELRARTTFEMLKESYYEHIHSDGNSNIELITDGGPENNNNLVNSFVARQDISMKKLTALVDIDFSNSLIESYNKLLKYRFLYIKQIFDFDTLEKYLPQTIQEYNEVRPHFAHRYLTPKEVFDGQRVDRNKFKNQLQTARNMRLLHNKQTGCTVCLQ
jgi:transposase InsO family protein